MTTSKLSSCPYCSSDMNEIISDHGGQYVVLCGDCEAQGPPASDEYHAALFWNERADHE